MSEGKEKDTKILDTTDPTKESKVKKHIQILEGIVAHCDDDSKLKKVYEQIIRDYVHGNIEYVEGQYLLYSLDDGEYVAGPMIADEVFKFRNELSKEEGKKYIIEKCCTVVNRLQGTRR